MTKTLPPIPTTASPTLPTPPPKFSQVPPSPAPSDASSSSWHSTASTLPSSPESASGLHPSYTGGMRSKQDSGPSSQAGSHLHPSYTGGLQPSREVSAGSYVVVRKPSKSCVRFADMCVVIPGKCKLKKSGTKGMSVLSSFLNSPTSTPKSSPTPNPCLRRNPSLPNLGRARSNTAPSMPPLPSKPNGGVRTDSLRLVPASPTLPAIQRDLLKSVRKTLTRSSSQKRDGDAKRPGLARSHSTSSKPTKGMESDDDERGAAAGSSNMMPKMSPSSLPPKMSRSKPCTVSLRACCEACLNGMAEEEERFTEGAKRLLAIPASGRGVMSSTVACAMDSPDPNDDEEDGISAATRRGRLMKRMSVDELEGAPLAEGLAKMHEASGLVSMMGAAISGGSEESEESDEELFPLPSRRGIPPSLSRTKVPEVAVDSGVESGCSSPEEDAFPLPKRRFVPTEEDDGLFPLPTCRKKMPTGMRVSSV